MYTQTEERGGEEGEYLNHLLDMGPREDKGRTEGRKEGRKIDCKGRTIRRTKGKK